MAWLIGIISAVVAATFGMELLAAAFLGVLAGAVVHRLGRLESRMAALEQLAVAEAREDRAFGPAEGSVSAVELPAVSPSVEQPAMPGSLPEQPAAAVNRTGWQPHSADDGPATPTWTSAETDAPGWTMPALADLERLLAGRLLALAGGLALVIGVVFFLGLAFSRGWIGPEARVLAGLAAGAAAFAGGSLLMDGRQRVVGHVLLAVGLAAVNLSLFAATRLYDFIVPELGLLGALVIAAAAVIVALRSSSQVIAAYGLVAVLAAPPVMGASATLTTVAFLCAALVGTTALAVARDWRWLPPAGFLLTAPQLATYLVDDAPVGLALGALAGFWLLHAVAASGEELRRRSAEPSPSSATVLLASAALLVWGGFTVLDGSLEPWRGPFLLTVALVHLGLGAVFLAREHDRHAFSLLAVGTGVTAITMAVPIQLGGPPVPIAWAAEAAALAWVAARRQHPYSAAAAVLIGTMAIGRLVVVEYPIAAGPEATTAIPFISGRAAALGFVLAAMLVAGWVSGHRLARLALGGVGVTLLAYALAFELTDPLARMVAWSGLAAGTAIVMRRFVDVSLMPSSTETVTERTAVERAPYVGAAFASFLALGATFGDLLPLEDLADRLAATGSFGTPWDAGTAAAVVAVALGLGVGYLSGVAWRRCGALGAAAIGAYALPFDVSSAWSVIGWAAVGASLLAADWVDRWDGHVRGASILAGVAGLLVLLVVTPLDRLVVDARPSSVVPLLNEGSLGILALSTLLVLVWRRRPTLRLPQAGFGAAAILGVYGLSVGLTDLFQAQLGRGVELEELQKQAQTALSVLWAALGGIGLAAGLIRRLLAVRLSGLALLGVATAKVFLIDLATLDVAYRVLAFIGLGLLLLASAWIVFRLQPSESSEPHRQA